MIQIGDIRIHLINDGNTLVDPGGMFGLVPRALWSKYFEPTLDHLLPAIEMCLLVQVGDQNIVIDTGLGNKLDEKRRAIWHLERPNGGLIDSLARVGLQQDDIHCVIDTHLHADHAAGNTYFGEDGKSLLPTFPNAEYVVQRREYEDAIQPNERTAATYHLINYQPLIENGQMWLLEGDTEIAPGVWGVVTRGHTPGHMSIRFESNNQHALFTCDLSSYAVHFEKLGWMTAYDVEPLHTLENKRRWQQWALEHDAVLIFPHEPKRYAGKLTHDEHGNLVVMPIDEPFV
ncbi:MAG: MBL fold metallo-hydrolase [Chitinophagaceae bacterium]|nr:MBL fold metallo-hydrolase [Anaerolineae bacterium]